MGASLRRPFKVYNIEARAAKAIELSKTVPNPAPRYPTEIAIAARNKVSRDKEDSNLHERMPELDERLKHVYVESQGDNPIIKTKRRLPDARCKVADPEFGYLEPMIIEEGRIPLRLAIEMINSHKDDAQANSAKILSHKYKLDLDTTYHILEYFQPFYVRVPKAEDVVGRPHKLLKDFKVKAAQKQLDSAQQLIDDYQNKRKT